MVSITKRTSVHWLRLSLDKPNPKQNNWVRCITAPNAGPMTGPGTNTWVLGKGPFVVIDPGPADESHVEAIYELCNRQVAAIVLTHTHRDHCGGAAQLRSLSGAPVVGAVLDPDDGHQELSALPVVGVSHLAALCPSGVSIDVVETPGHVANHLCFFHRESKMMFVGDHMMNGSTVVIIPPAGHMSSYLDSLRRLVTYPMQLIAPGHGDVITEPLTAIERLIQHRLQRESKVLSALGDQWRDLDTILAAVYDDIALQLLPIAKLSLQAHLIKLCEDQKIIKQEGKHWLLGADSWKLK